MVLFYQNLQYIYLSQFLMYFSKAQLFEYLFTHEDFFHFTLILRQWFLAIPQIISHFEKIYV